jgi:hypothetical protein
MRTLWLGWLALVLTAPPVAAGGGPRRTAETPRATDLLRAERLARQLRERLELPRRRASGWQRGGGGWDDERRASPPPPRVTIHVPRGRAPKE